MIRGKGATAYGPAAALWNRPAASPFSLAAWEAAVNGFEANSTSDPRTKSYAVFGQLDWKFTDRLTLTAGLRYTHEKKSGSFHQFHVAGVDLSTLPADIAATRQRSYGASSTRSPIFRPASPTTACRGWLTLSWQFADDALAYATYSRGNKSGGLNLTALPLGVQPDVAPEKVDSYEAGLKTQWLDRKVTFNIAGYWTEISDYQTAITEQIVNTVNFRQYIANIPGVRSRGFEADLTAAPSRTAEFLCVGRLCRHDLQRLSQRPASTRAAQSRRQTGSHRQATARRPEIYLYAGRRRFGAAWQSGRARPVGLRPRRIIRTVRRSIRRRATVDMPTFPPTGSPTHGSASSTDDGLFDLSIWARNLFDKDYFQTLSPADYRDCHRADR